MIHNMVSERYPWDEDDDASACDSTSDEDEDFGDDEVLTTSTHVLENSASFDGIVFGSFSLQLFRFLFLQSNQNSMDSLSRTVRFHAFSLILARTSSIVTILCSLLPKKTVT